MSLAISRIKSFATTQKHFIFIFPNNSTVRTSRVPPKRTFLPTRSSSALDAFVFCCHRMFKMTRSSANLIHVSSSSVAMKHFNIFIQNLFDEKFSLQQHVNAVREQKCRMSIMKREKGAQFITVIQIVKTKSERKKENRIRKKLSHSWTCSVHDACLNQIYRYIAINILLHAYAHKTTHIFNYECSNPVRCMGHGLCVLFNMLCISVHLSWCSRLVCYSTFFAPRVYINSRTFSTLYFILFGVSNIIFELLESMNSFSV